MTGHTCSNCGGYVECDKRNMGVGRKHAAGWKPSPNHEAVLEDLKIAYGANPSLWRMVPDIRGSLNYRRVLRKGRRNDWWDEDVQNLLSDLVGEEMVQMQKAIRGPAYIYRLKVPMVAAKPIVGLMKESMTKALVEGFFP